MKRKLISQDRGGVLPLIPIIGLLIGGGAAAGLYMGLSDGVASASETIASGITEPLSLLIIGLIVVLVIGFARRRTGA